MNKKLSSTYAKGLLKKIAKAKIAKALLRKVAHLKTARPLQQRNQSDLTVKLPPRYPTYEESRASVELPFMTPGLPRGVSQAVIRPGDVFQPIYAVRTLTPETGSNTFVPGRNQAPLQIPPPKPLSTREQLIRLGDILDRELERLQRFRRDMKFDEMPWNRGRRRGDTDLSAFRFANDVQPQPEAQPPLGPFFEDQEPTQSPFEVEPPAGYFLEGPDEEQEAFDTDFEAQPNAFLEDQPAGFSSGSSSMPALERFSNPWFLNTYPSYPIQNTSNYPKVQLSERTKALVLNNMNIIARAVKEFREKLRTLDNRFKESMRAINATRPPQTVPSLPKQPSPDQLASKMPSKKLPGSNIA